MYMHFVLERAGTQFVPSMYIVWPEKGCMSTVPCDKAELLGMLLLLRHYSQHICGLSINTCHVYPRRCGGEEDVAKCLMKWHQADALWHQGVAAKDTYRLQKRDLIREVQVQCSLRRQEQHWHAELGLREQGRWTFGLSLWAVQSLALSCPVALLLIALMLRGSKADQRP